MIAQGTNRKRRTCTNMLREKKRGAVKLTTFRKVVSLPLFIFREIRNQIA